MAVLQKILVPIDGSPSADRAIALALGLARRYDAELIFCHAIDKAKLAAEMSAPYAGFDASGFLEAMNSWAHELLGNAMRLAQAAKVRAGAFTLEGRPADAAVAYGVEREVDAIVIGTRGQTGIRRLFLGSTAEAVLRTAPVPVFVVHEDSRIPDAGAQPGFGSILVAVDDSDPSDAAAAFATALAAGNSTRLLFSHVIDDEALENALTDYAGSSEALYEEWQAEGARILDEAVETARANGVAKAEKSVVIGNPALDLLGVAKAVRADLIAIGTHGRRGYRRFLMGSVAEEVVRRSPLPVVVVRSVAELPHGRKISYHGSISAEGATAAL